MVRSDSYYTAFAKSTITNLRLWVTWNDWAGWKMSIEDAGDASHFVTREVAESVGAQALNRRPDASSWTLGVCKVTTTITTEYL